jgi:hypothetical protein
MFTRWSLLASALVLTLELGAGLSPTSVFPAFRWPMVAAYWAYATVFVLALPFITRSPGPPRPL